jgi:hypothetical protein
MEIEELSRVCELLEKTTESWLAQQDDLTRAIHRLAVDEIQAGNGAPVWLVIEYLYKYHPEALSDCPAAVAARVHALLSSEFNELSQLFSGLYQEFNIKYFGGALPVYRVRVMHSIPPPLPPYADGQICQWHIGQQELSIEYDGWPEEMIARLVHLMTHIQIRCSHDTSFEGALSKAHELGAPLDRDAARLRRVRAAWKSDCTSGRLA